MGASGGDKITRHHFSTLVNQLIKRVLTVGAWFAPDNWAGLVIHGVAVTVNVFTVGIQGPLLEVVGETVLIPVRGQKGLGRWAHENA